MPSDSRQIRVLLLENVHPSAHEIFASVGFDVETAKGALSEAELCDRLAGVHVLGIRSKTRVTAKVLECAKDLVALGAFCIGTNQIDVQFANARGVPVFNAPFSNTRSVAELIIAEIVMLSRQLGDKIREMHAGRWKKAAEGCFEVRGKVLGIVGYGHIGSQVGVLAEAMGMRVVFFDIGTKLAMGNNRACATLDELLAQSTFVTLHVPATPQTHEMIGEKQLSSMPRGSYLLNASRGNVVQMQALHDALRSGHIAGAAIDVFPEEPESNTEEFPFALQGIDNVILTPHIGGSTSEAQASIGREVGSSLERYVRFGTTTGAVNFPQLELSPMREKHRIANVHQNVPGVLRDINRIVSDHDANIHAQILATDPNLGYLLMDLDQNVAEAVNTAMKSLPTTIRSRILY